MVIRLGLCGLNWLLIYIIFSYIFCAERGCACFIGGGGIGFPGVQNQGYTFCNIIPARQIQQRNIVIVFLILLKPLLQFGDAITEKCIENGSTIADIDAGSLQQELHTFALAMKYGGEERRDTILVRFVDINARSLQQEFHA